MADDVVPVRQDVPLYGPGPGGGSALYAGHAEFAQVHGKAELWITGPFGDPIGAKAATLFHALIGVREQLPDGWDVLAKGARRDAWHSTDSHQCAWHEARLYPEAGQPPSPEPIAVMAPIDPQTGEARSMSISPTDQFAYHQEWAGNPPPLPDSPTWTEHHQ